MKRTLTAMSIAVTMFASSASAYDEKDYDRLVDRSSDRSCKKCDLEGAPLGNQTLVRKDLRKANLKGANLTAASLRGADLSDADLREAFLKDADLSGADLSDAELKGAYMNGAILCNTIMPDGSVIYSGC